MDPARYWMLTRRKLGDQKAPVFTTQHITVGGGGGSSASYYQSWEERAFAEDSAGHLGGCIWPPRSYSCSFCGREFRSAQALGGHMNVHRRDRARLKLSGAAEDWGSENHVMAPHQSYMMQPCPPQIGALQHAYGQNPSAPSTDTNPNSICSVLAYPSRSLVQAAAARTVWGKQVFSAPVASPSSGKEQGTKEMFLGAAQLAQDHPILAAGMCSNQELRVGRGELKLSVLGCRTRRDFEDDNEADDEKTVHVSRKRRNDLEVSPLVLCSSSSKHQQKDGDDNHRAKVIKFCPSSPVEELDLELRLGLAPKVK